MTHVVLAADEEYFEYAKCSLLQLARHAPSAKGVILVVPPGVSTGARADVEEAGRRFGVDVEIVEITGLVDLQDNAVIHDRGHVSAFTYSKLVLAEALPDIDRALYLDIDTLVRASLDDLLERELVNPIGAVPELGRNGVHLFGSTRVPYFNAGVLLMSLARLREERLWERSQGILRRNPRLPFQDQDVLNSIFRDRFDVLPLSANVFDSVARWSPPEAKVFRDPSIVHFVGPDKPWHEGNTSTFAEAWRRVHAESIGLPSDLAEVYVRGPKSARKVTVARSIATMRHSSVGRSVRGFLPMSLKHSVNMGLLRIVPPKSRLSRDLLMGMNAPEADVAPARHDGSPAGPEERVAQRGSTSLPARDAASSRSTMQRRPATGLHLVVSVPRSGTNALGTLVTRGVPQAHWDGELLYGQMRGLAEDSLHRDFPWIGSVDFDDRKEMGAAERQASIAEYRDLMNANVVDVVGRLMQGRSGPTVIKVLPGHIRDAALRDLMDAHRPRILMQRRTMLFSYLSLLKAQYTGTWFRDDTTHASPVLSSTLVESYVRETDAWFDWNQARILEWGLVAMYATYEGLLETRVDLPVLREFFDGCDLTPEAQSDQTWVSPMNVQDRRTDGSLVDTIAQLRSLSPANQRALLRKPGRTIPEASGVRT